MFSQTCQIPDFETYLKDLDLKNYSAIFKSYGICTISDISYLTPDDWQQLKVLPFHRNKLIQRAAFMKEMEITEVKKIKIGESISEILSNYQFQSSGPYNADSLPENLKNF